MISDGLPVAIKDDKLAINLAAARRWIEKNESAGTKRAPVLHPADPRYRERTAAAAIQAIEADLEAHRAFSIDYCSLRWKTELIELRSALLNIPSRVSGADTVDDAERALTALVDEAFSELKIDDPTTWPAAVDANGGWSDDDNEFETPDTLPILVSGDPRYSFARAKAVKAEGRFEALRATVVDRAFALKCARRQCRIVRDIFRCVPFDAVLKLEGDGPFDAAAVSDAARAAIYGGLEAASSRD
ncbi:MAG: hypothetical protein AB7K64_12440 [Variibacter sp.]